MSQTVGGETAATEPSETVPEYWASTQVAAFLGTSQRTVERLSAQGEIPYVPSPHGRLYERAAIEELKATFVPPKPGRPSKARE